MRKWSWKTWLLILILLWVLQHFLPPVTFPRLSDRELFEYFCEGVLVFLWMIMWDLNAIRSKLEK